MKSLLLALCPIALGLLSLGAQHADAAEQLVIIPLSETGDVTPPIADKLRAHLRTVAAAQATVIAEPATELAQQKANVSYGCRTAACGAGMSKATGARFVLSGTVGAVDEIYTVDLALYDATAGTWKTAKGTCELCAATEVDRTITTTFGQLAHALRVAPPPAAPAAPVEIAVEVTSEPDGAQVTIDGTARGATPIVVKVAPGTHTVAVTRDGFAPAERNISAVDRPVKLGFRLQPEAAPVVTPPAVTPPVTPPVAPTPPEGDDESGSLLYTGIGMLIGGAILTGGGAYLIIIDGDVTCTDGRGRRECPSVFNTKGIGMGAFGVGAALIGAGTTMVIVHALDDGDSTTAFVTPTPDGAMLGLGGRF